MNAHMDNKVEYRFVIRNNKSGTFLRRNSIELISFITRGDALNYLINNGFDISNYTILDWRNV